MKTFFASIFCTLLCAGVALADQRAVSEMNELLRGELSAIETYRQAWEKVKDQPNASELQTVLQNHQDAAAKLRKEIVAAGGTPSNDSGAWGTWAKVVMGSAKIFGDETALKALKEGEEHGLKEYKEALENKNLTQNVRNAITDKFIPSQQKHISTLNELINQA